MKIITRKAAISLGLKRYFTGIACIKAGHLSERLVCNWKCIQCNSDDHKTWSASNRTKLSNNQKAFKERHPDKSAAIKKKYKALNKEKVAETGRLYYIKNKEKISEYSRQQKQKNYPSIAARMRQYNQKNRGLITALAAKYRASKLKATPPWANLNAIRAIYEEASRLGMEVDHDIPLQGKIVCGLHVESNLKIRPMSENRRKSSKFNPADHEIRM